MRFPSIREHKWDAVAETGEEYLHLIGVGKVICIPLTCMEPLLILEVEDVCDHGDWRITAYVYSLYSHN